MTSDELELELVKMKIRVFVLEEILLSSLVSIKRGGGGLVLQAGQDQAKASIERAEPEIVRKLRQSDLWRELPEPKHFVAELVGSAISELASRVRSSNG
jgi:hypothetical protein